MDTKLVVDPSNLMEYRGINGQNFQWGHNLMIFNINDERIEDV